MKPLCPHCLKPLPPVDLPVCAHCGARLTEPAPAASTTTGPAVGSGESVETLIARFFEPPEVYALTWASYGVGLAAALVLPAGLLWYSAPPLAAAALVVFAGVLAAYHGITRFPPRNRVVIDRRGVQQRGRLLRWEQVQRAEAVGFQRNRNEPAKLVLSDDRGRQISIASEWTQTARIRSLRNLAAVLAAIIEAGAVVCSDPVSRK